MAIMFFHDEDVKVVDYELVLSKKPKFENGAIVVTDITDGVFREYTEKDVDGNTVKNFFDPYHKYVADYYCDNPDAREQETQTLEFVDHPSHYQTDKGIEVIDVIEAFTEQLTGVVAFDIGCAIKYMCRWKKKGGTQDLRKAIWYLEHAIKKTEGEDNGSVHSGQDNR